MGTPEETSRSKIILERFAIWGEVGIPILGTSFCPTWAWRTTITEPYRGGATVSAYDRLIEDKVPNAYTQSRNHMIPLDKDTPIPAAGDLGQILHILSRR